MIIYYERRKLDLITLYTDSCGKSPIEDFLVTLFKLDKKLFSLVSSKLDLLDLSGTRAGNLSFSYLRSGIWEVKVKNIRILFYKIDNGFLLLHAFYKKTKKTPERELHRALKEVSDWTLRNSHQED